MAETLDIPRDRQPEAPEVPPGRPRRLGLRAGRRRAQVVRLLGGRRLFPRRPRRRPGGRQAAVRDPDAAAERDRPAPHGPRAPGHGAGPPRPLPPDEGGRGALDSGHGPRRHRHAERRRAPAPQARRGPQGDGPRGVPREGLGLDARVRRHHPPAEAAPGRLVRLAVRAVHPRRRPEPGRPACVRHALRAGPRLPRRLPRQLGPREPDGDLERGGRQRRAAGAPVDRPLPRRRRERPADRRARRHRHDAAGDDPRRHGRGRPPGGRAVHESRREAGARARRRPAGARHCRRNHQDGLRDGRAEGDAGPRRERLRHRAAARPGDRLADEPRRDAQRGGRAVRRPRPLRGPPADRRGPRRERPTRQSRGLPAHGPHFVAVEGRDRAAPVAAVVRGDATAGGKGAGGRRRRDRPVPPGALGERVPPLARRHPRLAD